MSRVELNTTFQYFFQKTTKNRDENVNDMIYV